MRIRGADSHPDVPRHNETTTGTSPTYLDNIGNLNGRNVIWNTVFEYSTRTFEDRLGVRHLKEPAQALVATSPEQIQDRCTARQFADHTTVADRFQELDLSRSTKTFEVEVD
jgi:hypothetical protein